MDNDADIKIQDLHKAKAYSAIDDIISRYGSLENKVPDVEDIKSVMQEMVGTESPPAEAKRAVMRYDGIDSDIKWDGRLNMSPLADQQHLAIIESINKLQHACSDEQAVARSNEMLDTLLQTIEPHFAEEEKLMAETRYPKLTDHRVKHWGFLATVQRLKNLYAEGGKTKDFMLDMFSQVLRWYFDHMLVDDMEFARYYRKETGIE